MTTPAQQVLEPCPFCPDGGEPFLHQVGNEHTKERGCDVGCNECKFVKHIRVIRYSIDWAIERAKASWNTRAAQKLVEIETGQGDEKVEDVRDAIIGLFFAAQSAFDRGDDVTHMLRFGEACEKMMRYMDYKANGPEGPLQQIPKRMIVEDDQMDNVADWEMARALYADTFNYPVDKAAEWTTLIEGPNWLQAEGFKRMARKCREALGARGLRIVNDTTSEGGKA
jgi:hypothetical protein